MSAELAVVDERPDLRSLQAWADEMAAAAHIARGVAGTPFVPAALRVFSRGEPDLPATTANVAAALLAGRELGLEPMAALRSIHIVDGTPGLSALAMRALVVAAGHEIWLEQSSATIAVVRGRHAGSSHVQESRWTMERAERLGLTSRKGENWKRQPIAMLIARATAECARLTAPEALLGLPYSAEELTDGLESTEIPAEPQPAGKRRTARRRPIDPVPAPPVSSDAAPVPADAPRDVSGDPYAIPANRIVEDVPLPDADPAITNSQRRAIYACMRDLNITRRADRLALYREITRDPSIRSTTDMTAEQASAVLRYLEGRRQAEIGEIARQAVTEAAAESADGEPWDDEPLPFGDEPEF